MQDGKCALCQQQAPICDSHLIAAGFIKTFRADDPDDPNPVVVMAGSTGQTSKQVKAHLLCAECEDRFRTRGEEYTISVCCRGLDDFPLSDSLQSVEPLEDHGRFRRYDGRSIEGVDMPRLIYFASSVFWRASVHRWRIGWMKSVYSDLGGKYQEAFRRFLLDEGAFPENVAIHVVVGTDRAWRNIAYPRRRRDHRHHEHAFEVPGMQFYIEVGGIRPQCSSGTCAHKTGAILLGDVKELPLSRGMLGLVSSSTPSKKLKAWLENGVPPN